MRAARHRADVFMTSCACLAPSRATVRCCGPSLLPTSLHWTSSACRARERPRPILCINSIHGYHIIHAQGKHFACSLSTHSLPHPRPQSTTFPGQRRHADPRQSCALPLLATSPP
jgi:hypothetical protein